MNNDPTVLVSVNDFQTRALVDCGANISIIDEKLVPKIKAKVLPYNGPRIKTISGEDITPTHRYKGLRIQVGVCNFTLDPVITRNMSPMVLLGQDAMSIGEFTVDIKARKVIDTRPKHTKEIGCQTPVETEDRLDAVETDAVEEGLFTLFTKRITVQPFQTRFLSESEGLTCSPELLIRRLSPNKGGPIWISNPTPVKEEVEIDATGTTEVEQLIKIDLPLENQEQLSEPESSDYEEQVWQVIRSEADPELTLLEPHERVLDEENDALLETIDFQYLDNFNYNKNLSHKDKLILFRLLWSYADIFSIKDDDPLGRVNVWEHRIITEPDIQPIKRHPYFVSETQRQIIRDCIRKMLSKEVITPMCSPWGAPVTLVTKRDGSVRFCTDFRQLNAVTKDDSYPPPRIEEALSTLRNAKYFTTMDFDSCYWQIPLHKDSIEKTTFVTHLGSYAYKVMPFGLKTAPASCVRAMDIIFNKENRRICFIYMDDLLCHSLNVRDHFKRLSILFRRIRENNMKLKAKKCYFLQTSVSYLGHVIDENGIQPDKERISAVINKPHPTNLKELRRFLGFVSYYRRFIHNLSIHAHPLNRLLKKGTQFEWGNEQQFAYNFLISKLTSEPILTHFDPTAEHEIRTDASDEGLGAMLIQIQNGERKLVACTSRTLKPNEVAYAVPEKECLAIIHALNKFRPYLYGRRFVIKTDHHGLRFLMKTKDMSHRLTRWSLMLQDFTFDILYSKGSEHHDADYVSRGPFPEETDSIEERVIRAVHLSPQAIDFTNWGPEDTKKAQNNDPYCIRVSTILGDPLTHRTEYKLIARKYATVNGLLCRTQTKEIPQMRLCIPKTMIRRVLSEAHGDRTSHFGQKKTIWRCTQQFFWRGQYTDVVNFVKTCHECQLRKGPQTKELGIMGNMTIGEDVFHTISCDIITLPVTAKGNRYAITAVDQVSKFAMAIPIRKQDEDTVIRKLTKHIFQRFGGPEILVTDQGTNFVSRKAEETFKRFGIRHQVTVPHHPQSNGECERLNKTLASQLSINLINQQKDWDMEIDNVLLQYNSTIHSSTGYSPLYLLTGRNPGLTIAKQFGLTQTLALPDIKEARETALNNIRKQQNHNQVLVNAQRKETTHQVGDWVLLERSAAKISKNAKLQDHWAGPYQILNMKCPQNVTIKVQSRGQTTKEVHISQVKKYWDRAEFTLWMETNDPLTLRIHRVLGQGQVTQSSPKTYHYYNKTRNRKTGPNQTDG